MMRLHETGSHGPGIRGRAAATGAVSQASRTVNAVCPGATS
jgi:hypothetical protein